MPGLGRTVHAGDRRAAKVRGERRPRRHHDDSQEQEREDQQHQGGKVLVAGPEEGHHLDRCAQKEGQEPDGAARHARGDDPPSTHDAEGQPDEADDEVDAVAHEEQHQDDREGRPRGQ